MRLSFTFLILIWIGLVGAANAQPGWNWGADEATAQEKNALYNDLLNQKNYKEAVPALDWLLENTPDLNAAIYINGAKIYQALADAETDPGQKIQYQEKALSMYDLRIEHFKEEAKVLDRKAYVAYKYLKDRKEKYKELYDLFERTFELNGSNISVNNLVAYMDVIRRYRASGGSLSDEDVLERYDKVSTIIGKKIKSGKNVETLEKNRSFVDKMLTSMVKIDCDFIANKLRPAFEQDQSNTSLAKKIMGLSLTYECTKLPVFTKAAMAVQIAEPTFGVAKLIAIKSDAAGDRETAAKYYQQALELAADGKQKAEINYGLANHYRARGQKAKAREYALKAAPSMKQAYKLIGDLYMGSFNDCKGGVSKVADRAIFIAAYNMYQKAGNAKGMKNAEAQFPSMEEIFERGMEEGQTQTVGCWINETVSVKRRPSS